VSTSQIKQVPVADLSIDPRVQRQLDPRRVAKLAAEWDPKMIGVLTVSYRAEAREVGHEVEVTEEWIVLDGQTRYKAGEQAGITHMTAEVFEGLTLEEEAAIFLKHNDRKAVTPKDRYRLAVMAGEERALAIRDIGAKYGWYVTGSVETLVKGQRSYSAIGAVEKIYDMDGGKSLRRAFDVIAGAWGVTAGAICSETVYGIGQLFAENPNGVDAKGFTAKLSRLGLPAYLAAVGDRRRTHPGMSIRTASRDWTVDLYNRGRRTHRV